MSKQATGKDRQMLSDEYLTKVDAYWRAANYLAAAQLYMLDNPLLAHAQSSRAQVALKAHFGATARTIRMICIMLKIPV